MVYINKNNKILAVNSEKIITADLYTLATVKSMSFNRIIDIFLIGNTDFAVITM